jgi:predicted permease
MQDLRFALRILRKQPVFSLVAVLTLTIGIGANTAIFSVLYQILLRPLPYPDAGRLVFVWNAYLKAGHDLARVAIPDYLDRRAEAAAIEDATLFTPRDVNLSIAGRPEQVVALVVTPSFFSTLGRGPFLGRAFTEADAVPESDRFAILTYGLWTSRFGADRSVVGQAIHLNGGEYIVVGVLPADFEVPWRDAALLLPFSFTAAQRSDAERGNEFSLMIARLRPRATLHQLNAEMQTIVNRLMDRVPQRAAYMRNSGFTGQAVGFRDQLSGDVRLSLYLLQAGVALVLLIACANVANLLLMRATGRLRELAIRSSLGAGRWQIGRQLLIEGVLLSGIGGAAGLAFGALAVRALAALLAGQVPGAAEATIRPAVLAFTAALAVGTALVFGIIPVWSSARETTSSALTDDGSRTTAGRRTGQARTAVVIVETALAAVLLIGAGLLIKSFARVTQVDPGFSSDHVLTTQIALPPARYGTPDAQRSFWQRLLEKTRAMPGVMAVGLISNVPFSDRLSAGTYRIVGRPLAPTERPPHARQDEIGGDYFRAMQIPLIEGRVFNDGDAPDSPRVVVVDKFFADRQFPHDSAVGHQINFGSARNYTIVGVVGTVNSSDLARPVPEERIYLNATQLSSGGMGLIVKTVLEPSSVVSQVRAIVQGIDPEQPIAETRTMEEWLDRSLQSRRTPMTLLALFGFVALVLCAIGIYGVLAFGVAQRLREFGIRQALGADRRSILSLALAQGLTMTGVGIATGVAASLALTRLLQSMLFGVGPYDAGVISVVAFLLFAVGAAACYVPAVRATRVDPAVALRDA